MSQLIWRSGTDISNLPARDLYLSNIAADSIITVAATQVRLKFGVPRVICLQAINTDCDSTCDIVKWTHFPRYWLFVRGIHRPPVNYPPKGQWRGALMFSLICVWTNSWVNNRETGDLRRHHAYYAVSVMHDLAYSPTITSLFILIILYGFITQHSRRRYWGNELTEKLIHFICVLLSIIIYNYSLSTRLCGKIWLMYK